MDFCGCGREDTIDESTNTRKEDNKPQAIGNFEEYVNEDGGAKIQSSNPQVELKLSRLGPFDGKKIKSDLESQNLVVNSQTEEESKKVPVKITLKNSEFEGHKIANDESSGEAGEHNLSEGTYLGKRVFSNGTVYEGTIKDGKLTGLGRIVHENGDYYEGEFETNTANGCGKFCSSEGDQYVGTFTHGIPNGFGKLTNKYGNVYEGGFNHGQREGKGKLEVPNEYVYDGDFKEDKFHGYGTMKWVDGSAQLYVGPFYNNQFHGDDAKYNDGNDNIYTGPYHLGKRQTTENSNNVRNDAHGDLLIGSRNIKYRGGWDQGLKHGKGTIFDVAGGEEKVIFEGEWANGQLIDPEGLYTSHDQAEETKPAEQVVVKESTQIDAQPPVVVEESPKVVEEPPKVEEVTPPAPDSPLITAKKFVNFRDNKQNDEAAELCLPEITWDFAGDKVSGIDALRKKWAEADKKDPPPIKWEEFTKEGNQVSRNGVVKKAFMTINLLMKMEVEDGKLKSGSMGKK